MHLNKKVILKLAKYWLPVVLWAGIIFTFSSFPTVQTSTFYLGDFLLKKSAHIIEYGILSFLILRALSYHKIVDLNKKTVWYPIIIAFLYGITDEYHQSFVAGRTATIRDVLIDTAGAIIFIFGIIKNMQKMPKFIQKMYNYVK